ncbi:DUF1993 domain-containing protein [Aliivibrio logei]|uniref:DUF1993 domain-containing protein n=1 Tax=Aliivibrio logei TaxID=688 RepID=UPI0035C93A74
MTMLSDITLTPFSNSLNVAIHLMTKAKAYFEVEHREANEIVNLQLVDDMLPLSFQVNAICQHTLQATKAVLNGDFYIQSPLGEIDFNGLITLLKKTQQELNNIDSKELNARSGETVIFHYPEQPMTFTSEHFITSFSTPNLYFHQTTLYNLLRKEGVPLSKIDFIGALSLSPSK